MKRAWRFIKKLLIGLTIAVAVFLLSGFIVLRYFEDDVLSFALKRINTYLNTPTHVDKVNLTWWESFPLASIRFENVYIQETFPQKDTLFAANELLLSFSLWDVFSGDYQMKKVSASGAKAYLKVNKKGQDNWHFWKTDSTAKEAKEIDLKNITLSQSHVTYEDAQKQFFIDLTSDNASASGSFSDSRFNLELETLSQIHSLVSGSIAYVDEKNVQLDCTIDSDTEQGLFTLTQGNIRVNDLPFLAEGSIKTTPSTAFDLHFTGDDLDLSELVQLLPQKERESLETYNADGQIQFDLTLGGTSAKPEVRSLFVLSNGRIEHSDTNGELTGLQANARYVLSNGKGQLALEQLSAQLGPGTIRARGDVHFLTAPKLQMDVQLDAQLQDLKRFFAWDTLQTCEGKITSQIHIEGDLTPSPNNTTNWSALLSSGKAQITGGKFQLVSSSRVFDQVDGLFLLHGSDASVQNLHGRANGNDFEVNGTLKQLIPYLTNPEATLAIEASFRSKYLNFTELVEENEATKNKDDYAFALPQNAQFKLQTDVGKISFKTFEATNVKGVAEYANNKLSIHPVSFNTSGGSFMASLGITRSSAEQFQLSCNADFKNIEIHKLFTSFDNFGQTFITADNLKGKAHAIVSFNAPLSSSLRLQTDKLYSLIDIRIEEGQLNNLQALQQIAQYIKDNKWVAPFVDEDAFATKLKAIRFSTLENSIEIKNKIITIPLMDIRSSAMDISIRGTHTFDNVVDYTLGFNLRDILLKKEKEWQEVDDGLGRQMYLAMKGPASQPTFSLDKSASKENRVAKMEEEKKNIKALLKEELGMFKKDADVGTYKPETTPTGSTTTIEWEEFDNKEEKPTEERVKVKKTTKEPAEGAPKKVPKWLQEKDDQEEKDF
jgi:hypothetical protein